MEQDPFLARFSGASRRGGASPHVQDQGHSGRARSRHLTERGSLSSISGSRTRPGARYSMRPRDVRTGRSCSSCRRRSCGRRWPRCSGGLARGPANAGALDAFAPGGTGSQVAERWWTSPGASWEPGGAPLRRVRGRGPRGRGQILRGATPGGQARRLQQARTGSSSHGRPERTSDSSVPAGGETTRDHGVRVRGQQAAVAPCVIGHTAVTFGPERRARSAAPADRDPAGRAEGAPLRRFTDAAKPCAIAHFSIVSTRVGRPEHIGEHHGAGIDSSDRH